ncbi:MAG: hypothetical protein HWD62_10340 [Cyclobacteriaceae bacterium]|nr:hypothetical protein [Bacteroidetes bacterium CHB5]QLH32760.1 MAG: hypothetical protein HWD62_10340 [Cyclobacteriaceae bacterium]
MNYQDCPHYDEILKLLSEGLDLENISFEIDETMNCKDCTEIEGVCELWLWSFTHINHTKQMSIADAKIVIDNLNEKMGK